MTKPKNKMSWFERLNEADARQEAKLRARNKTAKATLHSQSEQQLDSQLPKPSKKLLVGLSLALPFLAWITAAASNPTGWASDDPSIILLTFITIPSFYWVISIPLLFFFFFLVTTKRVYASIVLVFFTSLIGSLYIFTTTLSADESEFTG